MKLALSVKNKDYDSGIIKKVFILKSFIGD
jgi:hypothetical protein